MLVLSVLLGLSVGCKQPHPGWEPPLEETSTRFLQKEVDEALQLVRDALQESRESGQAEDSLRGAVRALSRMSQYYLPLLEARERTYNAHRFFYYGEQLRARAEMETVGTILEGVVADGPTLLPVMREALDLVSEAKTAVTANSDEAPELMRMLASKLNYMGLKGKLEVPQGWLAESPDG
jgi:hypothetical protein